VPATGRRIAWSGVAFFDTAEGRITALWVLGDVDAVKRQLGLPETPPPALIVMLHRSNPFFLHLPCFRGMPESRHHRYVNERALGVCCGGSRRD
jgi:hypothetical protein